MKVGVVIPAYNVGDRLDDVLLKTCSYVSAECIFVIDDGSSDNSAEIARQHCVVLFQHPFNKGKGEALKQGFRLATEAGMDGIIVLDGDGQHDPDKIPDFIRQFETGEHDIILGTRSFKIGRMPLDRIFSNRCSSMIVSLMAGKWISDSQCGYRLIRTQMLKHLHLRTHYYEFESELLIRLAWKGARIGRCPIETTYDDEPSHIRRFRDTVRFCRMIISLLKEKLNKGKL